VADSGDQIKRIKLHYLQWRGQPTFSVWR